MYNNFSKLLQSKNLTANKFSKIVGIPQATLSDWKLGKSTPKLDKLQKICNYFNVSLSYVLDETDIKKAPTESLDERQKMINEIVNCIDKLSEEDLKHLEYLVDTLLKNQ